MPNFQRKLNNQTSNFAVTKRWSYPCTYAWINFNAHLRNKATGHDIRFFIFPAKDYMPAAPWQLFSEKISIYLYQEVGFRKIRLPVLTEYEGIPLKCRFHMTVVTFQAFMWKPCSSILAILKMYIRALFRSDTVV
uniref:AlNc14C73G4979 protein n=1 Tax=Albugo laibachii Nc14 TaxID=890382 RepID=F0WEC3_9STRA|nr:AlNc14C73G4979 [Albugo laibachii Nc14]|eukprot:CCA19554.1 AlNc14C73G4979 [Albugo laibachii Nc14]